MVAGFVSHPSHYDLSFALALYREFRIVSYNFVTQLLVFLIFADYTLLKDCCCHRRGQDPGFVLGGGDL
jgi:hypothetical protein